jgi:hypothetical protein
MENMFDTNKNITIPKWIICLYRKLLFRTWKIAWKIPERTSLKNTKKRGNGNTLREIVLQTDAPIHPIFLEKECYCITLHIIEAPYHT